MENGSCATQLDEMKIGITCYPTVGGSGILATSLGEELARRGHEVHFISYERPFRLPSDLPRLHFHPVSVNEYPLFKYPDYTLPLSVRMAEVSRDQGLDVLHVHYAVPHATAAILARSMLPPDRQPRVVTTLHGTDTTGELALEVEGRDRHIKIAENCQVNVLLSRFRRTVFKCLLQKRKPCSDELDCRRVFS